MAMDIILAIDQGTSSTRARLYSTDGEILDSHQVPLKTSYPKPGCVEQDGEDIWYSVQQVIKHLVEVSGEHKIIACGIANQRETSLLWQRSTGECLGPALVWQDRRTADWCAGFKDKDQYIHAKTGLFLDPYFSASKIRWMLDNYPNALRLLDDNDLLFGTVDSYLLWKLSNGNCHKTDVSNASRTMLFNIHTLTWDKDLLELFNIPASILPQVCASDAQFTDITLPFLHYDIPVCAVLGDQQAALVGQCAFEPGMVKATYGTGGFLMMNTGSSPQLSSNGLLTTIAYQIQGKTNYALEGSIYQAGTMIKWLRDELGLLKSASQSEKFAASLHSNEGVYLLPSFTGLGAPHWSTATGARIHGLSLNTKPAHFARAALEAVAYQTCDVLQCMIKEAQIPIHAVRVDGGMVVNNWLLQRIADQCELPVQRPKDIETTVYGVAMLAALGARLYDSIEALSQHWQMDRVFMPNATAKKSIEKDYQQWQSMICTYLK